MHKDDSHNWIGSVNLMAATLRNKHRILHLMKQTTDKQAL